MYQEHMYIKTGKSPTTLNRLPHEIGTGLILGTTNRVTIKTFNEPKIIMQMLNSSLEL